MSQDDTIAVPQDLVEAVWTGWQRLLEATALGMQAAAIQKLSDDMSDLITWSPNFDVKTGTLQDTEGDDPYVLL